MTYMGRNFKNAEEIKEWNKQGNINYFKKLVAMFNDKATMELSIEMSKQADILVNHFNMSWEEIDRLEIGC
jgi:hypothetical protein